VSGIVTMDSNPSTQYSKTPCQSGNYWIGNQLATGTKHTASHWKYFNW